MLSFLKNYKNYLNKVFFIIFLLVGINVFNDYGISIDEDNTRINGLVGLKYILSFFSLHTGDFFQNIPNIKDYNEKGIGYIFGGHWELSGSVASFKCGAVSATNSG